MKKLTQKLFKIVGAIVCAFCLCCACLVGFPSIQNQEAHAISVSNTNRNSSSASQLLQYVQLSIPDYNYTASDFYDNETLNALFSAGLASNETYVGTLFINSTVSLHVVGIEASSMRTTFHMREYDKFTQDAQGKYSVSETPNSMLFSSISTNTENVYSFIYSATPVATRYKAVFQSEYIDGETGETRVNITTYVFAVVQSELNYNTNSGVSYSFRYSTEQTPINVSDMLTNKEYPSVNLYVTPGTELNPTFIDFSRNGENYQIYNINGVFYNCANDEELDELLGNALPLLSSGVYEVSVYDSTTFTSSPSANVKSDTFLVNDAIGSDLGSRQSSVFITATTTNGDRIANGETTNDDIKVQFFNISGSIVSKIILRVTSYASGNIYTEDTVYTEGNFPSSLVCDKDRLYQIIVEFKPLGNGTQLAPYSYKFTIIKDIRTTYQTPNEEILRAQYDNIVEVYELFQTIDLNYGYGISASNTYHYNVKLARSNPSISGVLHNQTVSGAVSLVVRGVGTISVKITENGNTLPVQYHQSGDTINLAQAGKYTIKIEDEMGTNITKNFTINVQINTAGILLIVVGGLIVAAGLFFVIKSRFNLSVR
ncbi:MAG: hypothetical protein IJW24_03135 [Clostridia bacterium]|nr:hypothetical protein [Clostridia bacterium]